MELLRGRMRQTAAGVLVAGGLMLGCDNPQPAAALAAVVQIIDSQRVCAERQCQITATLSIGIQEMSGREVALQSVSGGLWDTRAMQDMHAAPAELSRTDILSSTGSSKVPAGGQLKVPYVLGFSIVQPYVLGPIRATIRVHGVDSDGNMVEAEAEGS